MAHAHCTEPGQGPGVSFDITLCTVHTKQAQGTIVFYCVHPGPCPSSSLGPV